MERERNRAGREVDPAAPAAAIAGKKSLVEAAYPTLARKLATAGEPTIHDAATAAVEHKGAGASVDATVSTKVGAHLGTDFSGVRVHSDPLAQEASAAIGARAFAHGSDVFLGAGESGADLGLMAHELTHVAQQGAAGQRAPQRKIEVGDANSPAEHEADAVADAVTRGGAPAQLLVDDGPVAPGQMLKSTFIAQLRAAVTAAADEELGPIYSAIGCPYIDQYFGRYADRSATEGEALLRRFAPGVRGAADAAAMIPIVVGRVRQGVRTWRDTGQPPPDLAAADPAAAASATAAAPGAQALRAPDGGDTLASLEATLGPGRALDGATASRMTDALGFDVSAARLHTGPVAAAKAADAGALAFTVGPNIVMGASAPAAGTIEGDALLAHELVHTAQQADAARDPAARAQPIGGEAASAEHAADAHVAAAATAPRGSLASRMLDGVKTGLQLQRCTGDSTPSVTPAQQAHTRLTHLDGLAEADFRREVAAMTRAETETLLANISATDAATYAALISRIRNERLVSTAEASAGDYYWAGNSGGDPSDGFQIRTTTTRRTDDDLLDGVYGDQVETNTNDFAVWVRGGAEPTDASKMNCWEVVMFSGYKAGVISRAWIVSVHTAAAAAGSMYQDVLAARLGYGSATAYVPGTAPPRGHIIFMNGLAHVALSLGTLDANGHAEVMSLWHVPFTTGTLRHNSTYQRTTIEALIGGIGDLRAVGAALPATTIVQHAPNPWS